MKIFVLLSRVPYPLIKGDKLRAFNQIKELSKNHDIYLCVLNDTRIHSDALAHLSPFCKEIKVIKLSKILISLQLIWCFLFTEKPLQVAYFYNKIVQKKINRLIAKFNPEHIYCQLIRTSEYVKNINNIPKTLDYMDSLSSGMQRRVKKAPFYLKWVLQIETKRLKKYEHHVFDFFEHKTIISSRDRDLIVNYHNKEIDIIENGVDHDYFHSIQMEKEYDLIFTGNMSYPPNIECATYLVREIMPLIWQKKPEISLVIAGANPSKKLQELSSEKVIFTGWVEDIRTYYSKAKVFIAPMQIGSGLQNKLLEAMSMKIPCITSDLANKSLGATEPIEIRIGKNADHYAQLVLDLLDNFKTAQSLAENGHNFVQKNFNWQRSTEKLNELITSSNQKK